MDLDNEEKVPDDKFIYVIKEESVIQPDNFDDEATPARRYHLREPVAKKPKKGPAPSLKAKKKLKTKKENIYPCTKCSSKFPSKTGLINHIRIHLVVRKYTCSLCQEIFNSNPELVEHKTVHKDEDRVFLCKICKMAFTDHCDFLIHEITHYKRPTYKCIECTRYFPAYTIRVHIETHYDKKVPCDVCGNTYKNEQKMLQHKKTHEMTIECGECGKLFANNAVLRYHMVSHTGVKKAQCLYCGVGFASTSQRDVHMRTHTNERPFKCDKCHRTFKQSVDLKRHEQSYHEPRKSFKCDFCDKMFTHKNSMVAHTRVHTKENLRYCDICKKGFQSNQCLKAHMSYSHSDERKFKCDVCNVSFKTKNGIDRHYMCIIHKNNMFAAKKETEG